MLIEHENLTAIRTLTLSQARTQLRAIIFCRFVGDV